MIVRVIDDNDIFMKYEQYLTWHIGGVVRAYNEIILPVLVDEKLDINFDELRHQMYNHDKSKYMSEEYIPYAIHWYTTNQMIKDENERNYRYAVQHHIHNNPHHWQHWVYLNDTGGRHRALDMDFKYVIEMLCDWHSFTLRDPNSSAYQWYQDNSKDMILSESTRSIIGHYIDYFKVPLVNKGEFKS